MPRRTSDDDYEDELSHRYQSQSSGYGAREQDDYGRYQSRGASKRGASGEGGQMGAGRPRSRDYDEYISGRQGDYDREYGAQTAEARARAVQDALEKAQQLAGLVNAQLGEAISITEHSAPVMPFLQDGLGGASLAAIEPGTQLVQVAVEVTFRLVPLAQPATAHAP
jgi:hypothetical protein